MVSIEEKYKQIGKAVIDECMNRAGERTISITLRSVQFEEKLYLRLEDIVEPISIWSFTDLTAICEANRQQRKREREAIGDVETIIIELEVAYEDGLDIYYTLSEVPDVSVKLEVRE